LDLLEVLLGNLLQFTDVGSDLDTFSLVETGFFDFGDDGFHFSHQRLLEVLVEGWRF
jgi:hypothetical protein